MNEIIAIVSKIARGLQKAHDLGIVHRDLKPDNIMIDPDGEPIVLDFGLARRINEDVQVTMSGVIVGTPAFMSPEQVDGDPAKIGPATDIYSLGIVLYHMLTGQLPFKGSLTSILNQIGTKQPVKPSAINSAIGEDSPLEQACMKMIAKSPRDRFASMAEVAAVLEALIEKNTDTPVTHTSTLGRLKTWSTEMLSGFAPDAPANLPAEPPRKWPRIQHPHAGRSGLNRAGSGEELLSTHFPGGGGGLNRVFGPAHPIIPSSSPSAFAHSPHTPVGPPDEFVINVGRHGEAEMVDVFASRDRVDPRKARMFEPAGQHEMADEMSPAHRYGRKRLCAPETRSASFPAKRSPGRYRAQAPQTHQIAPCLGGFPLEMGIATVVPDAFDCGWQTRPHDGHCHNEGSIYRAASLGPSSPCPLDGRMLPG